MRGTVRFIGDDSDLRFGNLGDYPQCFVGVVCGVLALAMLPPAEAHNEDDDDQNDEGQECEGGQDDASYIARVQARRVGSHTYRMEVEL